MDKLALGPTSYSTIGVSEYLKLAAIGRHSVEIEIQSQDVQGLIVIHRGEPWTAEDGDGGGHEALQRLMDAQGCTVTCTALKGNPGPRTLNGTLPFLSGRDVEDSSTPKPSPLETEFQHLRDSGIELTLQKRYREALNSFNGALALHPEDRTVEANIQRLTQLLASS